MGVLSCLVCCSTKQGSICCIVFSLIAIFFTGVLGHLLGVQWEYIHGMDIHNQNDARLNSLYVCAIYSGVFVISCISLFYHKRHRVDTATAPTSQRNIIMQDGSSETEWIFPSGSPRSPNRNNSLEVAALS